MVRERMPGGGRGSAEGVDRTFEAARACLSLKIVSRCDAIRPLMSCRKHTALWMYFSSAARLHTHWSEPGCRAGVGGLGVGVVGRSETHCDGAVRIADAGQEDRELVWVEALGLRRSSGA